LKGPFISKKERKENWEGSKKKETPHVRRGKGGGGCKKGRSVPALTLRRKKEEKKRPGGRKEKKKVGSGKRKGLQSKSIPTLSFSSWKTERKREEERGKTPPLLETRPPEGKGGIGERSRRAAGKKRKREGRLSQGGKGEKIRRDPTQPNGGGKEKKGGVLHFPQRPRREKKGIEGGRGAAGSSTLGKKGTWSLIFPWGGRKKKGKKKKRRKRFPSFWGGRRMSGRRKGGEGGKKKKKGKGERKKMGKRGIHQIKWGRDVRVPGEEEKKGKEKKDEESPLPVRGEGMSELSLRSGGGGARIWERGAPLLSS